MGIRKNTRTNPFLDRESAIKALRDLTEEERGRMPRRAMYLLQIINAHIQNGEEIYQRLPQEVFRGLPGGGRRNVQAAALCRAQGAPDDGEQPEAQEPDKRHEEGLIALWAQRDGCWSADADRDRLSAGLRHRSEFDGSEAHVFYDGGARIHKTVDTLRYPSTARFLDRIAIHNALFPEAALRVEGWGMREAPGGGPAFCAVVSQPFIEGTAPTQDQIDRSMEERGLVLPGRGGGLFYETPSRQVLVTDIDENNCVLTPGGRVVAFDCEAMVNDIEGFGGRFTIPSLLYDDDSVHDIHKAISAITPSSFLSGDILASLPAEEREPLLERIKGESGTAGPLTEGTFKGRIIQKDPTRKGWWIAATTQQLELFFRLHRPRLDDGSPLTEGEMQCVLRGEPFRRGGDIYVFSLDKGRADRPARLTHRLRLDTKASAKITI